MKRSSLSLSTILILVLAGCGGEDVSSAGVGGSGSGGSGGAGGAIQEEDFATRLAAIPGLTILEEQPKDLKGKRFVLGFEQPADHDDPTGPTFQQRIALLHRGENLPMVLATTGYGLAEYSTEPTVLLGANQLMVEQRFFAPSRPEPADWGTLRIRQAAADHHRIVQALGALYPGKWLSTGASKGGMTSVYHRRFYPDDVVGTVAYVAPQSYGDEDPRYIDFLENVGEPTCREALKSFQKQVLTRRTAMTARMVVEDGEAAYSQHGTDGALDYAVIELPFTFWQYFSASLCPSIPADAASDDEVWAFLRKVVSPANWSDESFLKYEPYYFQAAVELGYPGYDDSHLAGLLSVPLGSDVALSQVAPGPTKEVALDAGAMTDIAAWLSAEGSRMLFVYGENDPYSAAAFELGEAKDSYRFVVPGGNHGASIFELPAADQEAALTALSAWAGTTPKPPPPEALAEQREARLHRGRRAR